VARSLSEPATRRIDAEQSQGVLAATRRLVQAAHVLRLDVVDDRPRAPLPGLARLSGDLDALLGTVEGTLRAGAPGAGPETLPDLRGDYLAFERSGPPDADGAGVLAELDEIVDAANSLATLVGLEAADDVAREESGAATPSR
jgi:hypothetical protein